MNHGMLVERIHRRVCVCVCVCVIDSKLVSLYDNMVGCHGEASK
jgi:hypothetical protein